MHGEISAINQFKWSRRSWEFNTIVMECDVVNMRVGALLTGTNLITAL